MSKTKKILTIMLAFIMILTLVPIQADAIKKKIKLNLSAISMYTSKTKKIKVKNAKRKVKWTSSKKSIATVKSTGKYSAKIKSKNKQGKTIITAKVQGKKLKCAVRVWKKDDPSLNNNNISTKPLSVSASNTNINIGSEGTSTVNITVSSSTIVFYDIADTNIVSCKWGTWNNNTCPLYITGKKAGSTTITITNNINSNKIVINVQYQPIHITLPTTPLTLKNYSSSNSLQQTYKLTNITYEVKGSDIYLYFNGNKEYDYKGATQSSCLIISWKLYKKGTTIVVNSGNCYTSGVAMGESFENEEGYIWDLSNGEYELKILNTN